MIKLKLTHVAVAATPGTSVKYLNLYVHKDQMYIIIVHS